MYRKALAEAAEARGWAVCWYRKGEVFEAAARALGTDDIQGALAAMGKAVGPPWRAPHKQAPAAALAALVGRSASKVYQ